MINDWSYKPVAIVESDDTCDRWDRNGMNFLFYWKTKYPKFKITLFTIPNRTSKEMLELLRPFIVGPNAFIELAVHGWDHESNYECWGWDYDRTTRFMERVEGWINKETIDIPVYKKIFKSPGWMITGDSQGTGSGYPLTEPSLLAKDNQAVYKALLDRGYYIIDRDYNKTLRPESDHIICIDDQTKFVHMHTWPMEVGDKNQRNGYQQVVEEHGEPWDNNTEFYFISEAIEKGLIDPCKG